jgi:hypothetical protein
LEPGLLALVSFKQEVKEQLSNPEAKEEGPIEATEMLPDAMVLPPPTKPWK